MYSVFFFCEESLERDTNLHSKDCSKMHSGSCIQMTSSCKCPISLGNLSEAVEDGDGNVGKTIRLILHKTKSAREYVK